jgi:thioredoxin-like negative regulator of GroEL
MVGILALIGFNNILRSSFHIRKQYKEYLEDSFKDTATKLINENDLEKANKLLSEKLQKEPNHSHAIYFLARLQYIERDFDSCTETLHKLLGLSPEWKEKHIDPLLNRIEEIKKEKANQSLNVDSGNSHAAG